MKKPPAFQMYAADFLVDTDGWTATEVGIYTRLLMSEWVNGKLPEEIPRLARIAGIDVGNFLKCWARSVGSKFSKNGTPGFINQRLEFEREKQLKYRESQSEKGKKGGRPIKSSGLIPALTEGNQGESSSSSSLNNKKPFSLTSIEFRLSELLFLEIQKRKLDFKRPNLENWAKSIDLMIRIDKRTEEKIREVIVWCQKDDFWQNNILSTSKLREKFDQLDLKMRKQPKQPAPQQKEQEYENVTGQGERDGAAN